MRQSAQGGNQVKHEVATTAPSTPLFACEGGNYKLQNNRAHERLFAELVPFIGGLDIFLFTI